MTRPWHEEVGPGWTPLVDRVVTAAQAHEVRLVQVKEKLGALRIYVDKAGTPVDQVITDAERESVTVCEVCGAPGRLRSLNWIKTLCDHCLVGRFWERLDAALALDTLTQRQEHALRLVDELRRGLGPPPWTFSGDESGTMETPDGGKAVRLSGEHA